MTRPDAQQIAEQLYEELGGLCICQQAEVVHWCESCQHKIGIIVRAITEATATAEAELKEARHQVEKVCQWKTDTERVRQLTEELDALKAYIAARTPARQGIEPQYDQSDADAFYLAEENRKLREATATAEAELARRDQDLEDAVNALADKVAELAQTRLQLTEARRQVWEEAAKVVETLPVTDHDGDDLVDLHDVVSALRQRAQPVAQTEETR